MNCKTCEYPLWNLSTRQCPECGEAFRPSDYEFANNSVSFCCPHCNQDYYGTGDAGHIVPREFDCVRCGQHVDIDSMVLRPAAGVTDFQTRVDTIPWLDHESFGWWKRWWKTVGMALMSPGRMMIATPVEGATGRAWWFCLITLIITTVIAVIPITCLMALPMMAMPSGAGGPSPAVMAGVMASGGGLMMIVSIVGTLVIVALWGLLTHALLRMGAPLSAGIGRTYQALLFSSGANIISAAPCIGQFGFIWWLVSAVIAMKDAHRISGLRASVMTLAPPIVLMVLGAAAFAAAMAGAAFAARGAEGPGAPEATFVGTALRAYHDEQGVWPAHAIELVDDGFGAANFVAWSIGTTKASDVALGEVDLEELELLPTNRKRLAITAIAEAMPDDVVAHRIGDFVFTYHGIVPAVDDPGLWTVILSPDPGASGVANQARITVHRLDGTTRAYRAIAPALAEQNALRAAAGLDPLPDPSTIMTDAPALNDQ